MKKMLLHTTNFENLNCNLRCGIIGRVSNGVLIKALPPITGLCVGGFLGLYLGAAEM